MTSGQQNNSEESEFRAAEPSKDASGFRNDQSTPRPSPHHSEGWLVAAIASLMHTLIVGGVATAGILIVEWGDYFSAGKAQVSWIGAIQLAVGGIGSLFLGGFVARFGCRVMAILGTLITCVGYVAGAYSNNIPTLCITLGLFAGIGHCCMGLASTVAVQTQYVRRRSLATSVMMIGLSVGIMVWPPWTEYLIRIYNWRGAILINAAITLHGLPLALMFNLCGARKSRINEPAAKEIEMEVLSERKALQEEGNGSSPSKEVPLEISELPSLELLESPEHLKKDGIFNFNAKQDRVPCDIDNTTSENQMNISAYHSNQSQLTKDEIEKELDKLTIRKVMSNPCSCIDDAYFEILKRPDVVLYILAASLVQFGHIVAYTYVPTRAVSLNISKEMAATLVSMLGILAPVGRLGSGFLGDILSKHRLLMFSISGICTGISSILAAFAFNYAYLVVYGVVFAIVSGCYVCFLPTVLTDLVGIKRLPQALSVSLPLVGISILVSITTSGFLMDVTQSTAVAFLYCGGVQALGGVLGLAAWRVSKRKQAKQTTLKEHFSVNL